MRILIVAAIAAATLAGSAQAQPRPSSYGSTYTPYTPYTPPPAPRTYTPPAQPQPAYQNYGQISPTTNKPMTETVSGYVRKDGTYVNPYARSH